MHEENELRPPVLIFVGRFFVGWKFIYGLTLFRSGDSASDLIAMKYCLNGIGFSGSFYQSQFSVCRKFASPRPDATAEMGVQFFRCSVRDVTAKLV